MTLLGEAFSSSGETSGIGFGVAQARCVMRADGIVMSGRRSLIKGYFWRCAGRGCGHVFGLVLRTIGSAGPDVVR